MIEWALTEINLTNSYETIDLSLSYSVGLEYAVEHGIGDMVIEGDFIVR